MVKILWIDDEIEMLKPHFIFLKQKGYDVIQMNNAQDGLEIMQNEQVDMVFLDQNMPGISGLEILPKIKKAYPNTPVVMITKSEEESVMDDAISSKVDGYLIKPVNPNQILLIIKQKLHNKELLESRLNKDFQESYRILMQKITFANSFNEWQELYKEIVHWDLEVEKSQNQNIYQEFVEQLKTQANTYFCKFVEKNYLNWVHSDNETNKPLMISELLRKKILPAYDKGEKIFLLVIDNLRFDQWLILKPYFSNKYNILEEQSVCTILPSVTQYARNALFAGLMPYDIEKRYPQFWTQETDEGNKNDFEEQLINEFFIRNRRNPKISYHKILNENFADNKLSNVKSFLKNDINVIVFNFIDILSHSKTQLQMIKDLAKDDAGYRSLVNVWFERSYLKYLVEQLANQNVTIIITTDHGSVAVRKPIKVVGDKLSSNNIRYKQGKNLNFNEKEVFLIDNPAKAGLPLINLSTRYIFSRNNDFILFPQNYHDFTTMYMDSYQHGGISLEEMIIPFIIMKNK